MFHAGVEHTDALGQRAQEALFLFFHHASYQLLLRGQLRISVAHLPYQHGHKLVDESVFLSQERVGITDGAAQDAANDVTRLGVAGQLAVGDGESYSPEVVSANSHGHVHVLLLAILQPAEPLNLLDDGLEDVGIIVGVLVLQHAHQSLKAHAGVYHVHGQRLQRAVGLAVVLHEHDVPYLDHLGIVLVHHFPARHLGFFLGRAGVHVYLRAGAAGTRVAHLPEVVVLVAVDDMVLWHVLGPVLSGLVITGKPFFGRAFEYGDVQVLGVQAQHVH